MEFSKYLEIGPILVIFARADSSEGFNSITHTFLWQINPLGADRKYCREGEAEERDGCTNQVQVCLIAHIKVDKGLSK